MKQNYTFNKLLPSAFIGLFMAVVLILLPWGQIYAQQSTPFLEDWETGGPSSPDWGFITNTNTSYSFNGTAAYNGSFGIDMQGTSATGYVTPNDINDAYALSKSGGDNEDWTLSASINADLSGLGTEPQLKFYYSMGYADNDNHNNFWVIVTDVTTDTTILFQRETPGEDIEYLPEYLDLSSWAGQTITVHFIHNGPISSNYLYLDDIQLRNDPLNEVDWCNLRRPRYIFVPVGSNREVFARVFETGRTELPDSDANIKAWIGVNETNTDPASWTSESWKSAYFVSDVPLTGDDEYSAFIGTGRDSGTYYYASRFQIDDGPFSYGGVSADPREAGSRTGGFWDGIHNVSGRMEVTVNINQFPYVENFDVDSLWHGTQMSFGWEQSVTDDFDWEVGSGSTPTANTGPDFDHTKGDTSGNYLFIEATGHVPSQTAALMTLPFEIGSLTSPILEFWYHMEGSDIGELSVDVWDEVNGWTNGVWSKTGEQSSEWERAVFDLTTLPGDTVRFRFNGTTGASGDLGDIAIDDFYVGEPYATDIALTDFFQFATLFDPFTLAPDQSLLLDTEGNLRGPNNLESIDATESVRLSFIIENKGNMLTNYTLFWLVNAATPFVASKSPPGILPGQTRGATWFSDLPDSNERGTFTADAWVTASGDIDSTNNTARLNHLLVYPDNPLRQHYDDGDMLPEDLWAPMSQADSVEFAVRYTVEDTMILAQFDVYHAIPFLNPVEALDPIVLNLYRSGADSTMPGTMYYSQSYTDTAYFAWDPDGAYVSLPIPIDSNEIYYPGDEFWVGIKTYMPITEAPGPQIGIEDSLSNWYRSFYSIDGGTWTQLAFGAPNINPGFMIRTISVPYTEDYFDLAFNYFFQDNGIPNPYGPVGGFIENSPLQTVNNSTIPSGEVLISNELFHNNAEGSAGTRHGKLGNDFSVMSNGNNPFSTEGIDSTETVFYSWEAVNQGIITSPGFDVDITLYTSTPFVLSGSYSPISPGGTFSGIYGHIENFGEVGTFSADAVITAAGDIDTTNNRAVYEHTLVYPTDMIREHIDLGNATSELIAGVGSGIETTAIQRLTAPDSMLLSNIDVYLNTQDPVTEAIADTVLLQIFAEGVDSTSMGSLLFSKGYVTAPYLPITPTYISLGLPADSALGFLEGEDFWVAITVNNNVSLPFGIDTTGISEDFRSFVSIDRAATYGTFLVNTEKGHWMIRAVGTPHIPSPDIISTIWVRSDGDGTIPPWFSTTGGTERALAFGYTSNNTEAVNPRLFAVSRNSGNHVYMMEGFTGTDVGELDLTGVSGGTFAVSDVEVSDDGMIFVCNLTVDASSSALKVYAWHNEDMQPEVVLSYTSTVPVRLGDKFTVYGNYADGSAVLWFGASDIANVYKFRQPGPAQPFNIVPEIVPLSAAVTGGSATAGPLGNEQFYWNAGGQSAMKYDSLGTQLGVVSGGVVPSGANSIKYMGVLNVNGSDREHFITFQGGSSDQNSRIVELPSGDTDSAATYVLTPNLGTNSNANGTGDVDFQIDIDGTAYLFVLATNNGIGVYKTAGQIPVELTAFTSNIIDRDVELRWVTASELNSSEFVIERAINNGSALSFKALGSVEAAGNSANAHTYNFTDVDVQSGEYSYRLKMIDNDGSFAYSHSIEVDIANPEVYELSQNYPNPFNPATKINYSLPFDSKVKISIYNALGEMVEQLIDVEQSAGFYTLNWDATRYASGVYFYSLTVSSVDGMNDFRDVKKMMLLK